MQGLCGFEIGKLDLSEDWWGERCYAAEEGD